MLLHEFYDLLNRTDWYYEMSDSPAVYRRGQQAIGEIHKIAEESPAHQMLYADFVNYIWHGSPRPERPKVGFVSGLSDIKAGD